MDAHFQQLVEVCQRGILELKEPTWNTSELDNCHNQRIPFDLAIWRQRLEEAAKGIDFCGGYLFTHNDEGGQQSGEQHFGKVKKLIEHSQKLIELVLSLPLSIGTNYRATIRDATCSALVALCRIHELYFEMRRTRQSPATFVWNQTLRIRDIPGDCLVHLQIRWERWSCQLREACEEFKILINRNSEDDSYEDDERNSMSLSFGQYECSEGVVNNPLRGGGSHCQHHSSGSSSGVLKPSEVGIVKECETLIRLVRSLFRKVKIRCIPNLQVKNPQTPGFVDQFFTFGESITLLVEDLALHLFPPHDVNIISSISRRIVFMALELLKLSLALCPENNRKWFTACSIHLDELLSPIIERNPVR